MGTFTIPDPYAGKSAKELRADCRRLLRAAGEMQDIMMWCVNLAPEVVEKLPEPYRKRVKDLIEAYSDPEDEPAPTSTPI